jgi:EAL domain-containing protein (putative c-di-GMP-specific phosphodiesterase class I)
MTFIYEYDIAAVLTVLAILINLHRKKIFMTKTTRIFTNLLVLVGISCIIDIASSLSIEHPFSIPLWFNYLLLCLYFIIFTAIPLTAYLALVYATGLYKKKIPRKAIILIPYFIEIILILISPFTRTTFYFDENLVYCHGFFFILLYVASTFYILLAIIVSIVHGKSLSRRQKGLFHFFVIICFIGLAIQIIFPEIIILGFLETVAIFSIYMYLENPDNYIDKEMNMYNRLALSTFVNQQFEDKKDFSVIGFTVLGLGYLSNVFDESIKIQLYNRLSEILQISCGKKNIYRFANNNFVVILKNDKNKLENTIELIKILFEEPIRINDSSFHLTTKIIYFTCPEAADSTESVMDLIEYSLADVMKKNITSVQQTDKYLLQIKYHEKYISNKLQQACKKDELEVVYKPIFSVRDMKLVAADTEIRFMETELQNLKSKEIISIAEKNDFILQIDDLIINKICLLLQKNPGLDKKLKSLYVTLSPLQFLQKQMTLNVLNRITININPKILNFVFTAQSDEISSEYTESQIKANIDAILNSGAGISLENFGAFDSYTFDLIKYPFNVIRLSNTIISDAIFNEKSKDLLKSLIKVIKALKLKILATGIETKEQLALIKKFECDYAEGKYFSELLNENEFLELLDKNESNGGKK